MKNSKLIITVIAGLMLVFGAARLIAQDASKEVTIAGNMVCAKCTLHLTKTCQNVVQVMEDGKTVNYFLKQNEVSKAAHEPICGGDSEKVKVTGTVTEKDGQKIMTPTKIEPVKS
jgi:hypothetical protein